MDDLQRRQTLALNASIGIYRTASTLEALARQDVQCYGLNVTEFSVLELLFHKGAQSIQVIKEKILIASSSTTYVIDQLVKKGYVERIPSDRDRRVIHVVLTAEGEKLIQTIFPTHAQVLTNAFERLSDEELQQLQKLLRKIND